VLGLDPLGEPWAARRARDSRLEQTAHALADLVTRLAESARARGDDALADRLLARVREAMDGVRPARAEAERPCSLVAG